MQREALMLILISIILLPQLTQSECSIGCLACSESNGTAKCDICNVYESYIMTESGKCSIQKIDNCEVPSADANHLACYECSPGYALNHTGKGCLPVAEKYQVQNCLRYHWNYKCKECKTGFHLTRDKKCTAIKTLIENCKVYIDQKVCKECETGFYFDKNSEKCESITSINQCMVYSSIECLTCASGYFQNSNLTSATSLTSSFIQDFVAYLSTSSSGQYEPIAVNKCVLGSVQNCKTHLSFDQCQECNDSYFLNSNKQCILNPSRKISHCKAYGSANNCTRCEENYYLREGFCYEVSSIGGCLSFEKDSQMCSECDQKNYFLSGGNCAKRNVSLTIDYCKTMKTTSDLCEACISSFQITNDFKKCLPHIPHCETYLSASNVNEINFTNFNTTEVYCDECDKHFYRSIDRRFCNPQNLLGCKKFQSNKNLCDTCASGYYKDNKDVCVSRTSLNCETYKTDYDKCDTCFEGFFKNNDLCKKYSVTNCKTYKTDDDKCDTCFIQFFKKDNSACIPRTSLNCKTYKTDEDKCDTCYDSYFKTNKDCLPVKLMNCAKYGDTCEECVIGFYLASDLCKPYTIRNCKIPKASVDECDTCEDGFILDANGKCILRTIRNCSSPKASVDECNTCEDGFILDAKKNCILKTLRNCNVFNNTNKCTECNDGYSLQDGECVEIFVANCKKFALNVCDQCNIGYYKFNNICKVVTAEFCKTYHQTLDQCVDCIQGYIKQDTKCKLLFIDHCAEYNTSACFKCNQGYYLNNTSCDKTNIANCAVYKNNLNECYECRLGFELVDLACTKQTLPIEGCASLKHDEFTKCQFCHRGYFLNNSEICEVVPVIVDCVQYIANSKLCEFCVPDKVLGSDSETCDNYSTIQNCQKHKYNENLCEICEELFYLTNNTCSPQDITNCTVYVPNENRCLQCDLNYSVTIQGLCQKINLNLPNCEQISSDLESCQICSKGFYPKNGVCSLQSVTSCVDHAFNKNKCVICAQGHYLLNGVCFVEPAKEDYCYRNFPNSSECHFCKSKYYKDNDGRCVPRYDGYDLHCEANDSTLNDCSFCSDGTSVVFEDYFKFEPHLYLNCLNRDSAFCKKCHPGLQMSGGSITSESKDCTATYNSENSSDTSCYIYNEKASSTDPALCQECNSRVYHFNSSGICTVVSGITDCGLYKKVSNTEELCERCTSSGLSVDFKLCNVTQTVSNCSTATVGNSSSCDKCNIDYVLNSTSTTCEHYFNTLADTDLRYCLKLVSASECDQCEDNYILYNKKCYKKKDSFCISYSSSGTCDLCMPLYEQNSSAPYKCQGISSPEDNTCIQKDNTNQKCLLCNSEKYFPIKFDNNNYICIDQKNNEMRYFLGFDLTYNILDNKVTLSAPSSLISTYWEKQTFSDIATFKSVTSLNSLNKCVKFFYDDNKDHCIEWNNYRMKCSKCAKDYYLNEITLAYNICDMINLSNCEIKDENGFCIKCENKYSLSENRTKCNSMSDDSTCAVFGNTGCVLCKPDYTLSDGSCTIVKSKQLYCELIDRNTGECLLCQEGYLLDIYNNCYSNFIDNCLISSNSVKGICIRCKPEFVLTNGICIQIDPSYNCMFTDDTNGNCCMTMNNSTQECSFCYPGYSLKNKKCIPTFIQSISGCRIYNQSQTLCIECDYGLILSNGYCASTNLQNCEVKNNDLDICEKCETGYFSNRGQCQIRTNLNCLNYNDDADTCTSCPVNTYLDSTDSYCHNHTVENCLTYHPKQNWCTSCKKDYIMSRIDGLCIAMTVSNCKTHHKFIDMCTSCEDNMYMTSNGQCIPRTLDQCLKADPYSDSCYECKKGQYLYYDTNFYDCISYTVENCKELHLRENKCLSCQDNYYLNLGTCIPKTTFNCKEWDDKLQQCSECPFKTYLLNGACYNYTVSGCKHFNKTSNSCISCTHGFYLNNEECIAYTVSNCQKYNINQNLCSTCIKGFFFSNGLCNPNLSKNCEESSTEEHSCLVCIPGFFLQNGVCQPYSISCKEYNLYLNKCISCPSGQFLEITGGICVAYTVKNCLEYHLAANKCFNCSSQYYLEDGTCMPYTVANCKVYHPLIDECVTCPENFYHKEQKCKPYNIKNCTVKNLISDVCLQCNSGFYNDMGSCFAYTAMNCKTYMKNRDMCEECVSMTYKFRLYEDYFECQMVDIVEQCKEYKSTENKCENCNDGYYLEENLNSCNMNPDTIENCFEYSNDTTCFSCLAPYYLEKNKCVKSDNIIIKCNQYTSNSTCSKCEGANMLSEDKKICNRILEPSCATYKDTSNCLTCKGNNVITYINDSDFSVVSGLNGETLTNRRAVCRASGIENCSIAQEGYPTSICNKCDKNFFLSSKSSCELVTILIDHCDIYFANGICSQCLSNHVLTADKTHCKFDVSFLGTNCQEGKFYSKPKCLICQAGYYFDSKGDCVKCEMIGCAVCTQDFSSSCRMCLNGYYMDSDMKCKVISTDLAGLEGNLLNEDNAREVLDTGMSLFNQYNKESIAQVLLSLILISTLIKA